MPQRRFARGWHRRGNGSGAARRRWAGDWRRPYIYKPEEVRVLLDIARTYPSPRARLRPLTLYTMMAVGYCAGLRVSEIARLNLGDVDLQVGTITIRETKFFKSGSCRWPKASPQHFANTWKRGGALERRRVLSRACSGMTRTEHATRPSRSCGCSSIYCGELASNHHEARRGLAFMTCVTPSW